MGFSKKNITSTPRNGLIKTGTTVVKYITKGGGVSGKDGEKGLSISLGLQSYSFQSNDGSVFDQSINIDVIAYNGTEKMDTSIGTITGAVQGMTTTINNNGDSSASVTVSVSSNLMARRGYLTIPVTVNTYNPRDVSGNKDASYWDASAYDLTTCNVKFNWTVTNSITIVDVYALDLSNQMASINCDASGNVLSTAVMPSCTAELTYSGGPVVDASYSIDVSNNLRGVSINSSTGVLTFNASTLSWDTTSTKILVKGWENGEVKDTAEMLLMKSMPGPNGEDAVSYWLNISASKIKVDPNNSDSITPSSVTAEGWKQVGGNPATSATDCSIFWGYNTTTPTTRYTMPITTIDKTKEYMYFILKKDGVLRDEELVPIIWEGRNGADAYQLDLTNENASINCDASGNILPTAVRPSSTARFYVGGTRITSGVTYSIDSTTSGTTGVSINSTSGQLTFSSSFNFTSLVTEITVKAVYGSITKTRIMTVSKSLAGKDGSAGTPAESYWLEMSANEVYVDVNNGNACTPTSIAIKAWKQTGGDAPVQLTTSSYVKYSADASYGQTTCYGTITPSSFVPQNKYITVTLYVNSVVRDNETILLLRNGADGSKGDRGLRGATVRGPVKWVDYSSDNARRFCSGSGVEGVEDASYIDVVMNSNDGSIYVCTTSFTGTAQQSWSNVSSYFTLSTQYKFVATDLLLAKNAKINFLSNNELYLLDSSDNITAGAKGSDSSNDINFWAGSSVPANAPFQVNNAGAITAKSGTFAGYVQYPYTFISSLEHYGSYYDGYYIADKRANLIADEYSGSYGMGDGAVLLIPEPCEEYNGFTYNIIAISNIATKSSENTSISLVTSDSRVSKDSPFKVFTFFGTSTTSYAMLKFYGGKISVTCMPYHIDASTNGYYWALTEATGGVDCYGVNQFEWRGAGGGGYWNFYSGEQITARISAPPLNYSAWGSRYFRTSSTPTTLRVTVSGNTMSSRNVFYLCLDTQTTSSAVLQFSNGVSQTYTVTLSDNTNHAFNMFYSKKYSTSSDVVYILFEVVSSSDTLEYANSTAPVCGYSENSVNNAVVYIVAENNVASMEKNQNALYVSRN